MGLSIGFDNMYKMLAFTGLFIVATSTYWYGNQILEAFKLNWEMIDRIEEGLVLNEDYKKSYDELAQARERLRETYGSREMMTSLSKYMEMLVTFERDKKGSEESLEEISSIKKRYETVSYAIELWLYFYIAGCAIGLVMAVSGFVLWYRRIQRYQDIALRESCGRSWRRGSASRVGGRVRLARFRAVGSSR